MFVVSTDHPENTIDVRVFSSSSEEAVTPACTSDVRRTVVGIFADDTKQTTGYNQFCESHSALQQLVVCCAALLPHSKEVIKWEKRLIGYKILQLASGLSLREQSRMSVYDLVVVSTTHH